MTGIVDLSNQPQIGDLVNYIFKDAPCKVIATKNEPHIYRFGNEELDKNGWTRPVPHGYHLTVIETGLEFSPYIDVKISEIR